MKKIFLCCLCLVSCANNKFIKPTPTKFPTMVDIWELDYLQKTLDSDRYILLDLRAIKLYQKAHIYRALSLPYNKIESITNIPNYNKYRIIFYDQKKVNYGRIAKTLFDLNITNFSLLEKGYIFWEKNTTSE